MGRTPHVSLPDEAFVCRGGTCSAERFHAGAGVTLDEAGRLHGVSVNSAAGAAIDALTASIPNRQIGVTTVGIVRRLGGSVTPAPSANNRFHCVLGGITPEQAARLFTPVVPNPNR
jgi:hypothetical protein